MPNQLQLTKADLRRIEEDARRVSFRIDHGASAYARLYEKTYLQAIRDNIDQRIWAIDQVAEGTLRVSQPEKEEQP